MFLCNTRFSSPQHSLDSTTWTLESKDQGSCKRVTKLFENDWKCPTMLVATGLRFAFRVTCPFHEGRVWLPSFWLYSLIPPSGWFWSLSLLPGSSQLPRPAETTIWSLPPSLQRSLCWVSEVNWRKGVARRTSEPAQDKSTGEGEWHREEREDGENHGVNTKVSC